MQLPQVILPKALVLQDECFGKNYSSFLDFTRNYEPPSGIFVLCIHIDKSSLELLHVIFCTFVPESWPLIYAKILFQLNIYRTNRQIFTKFYICIYIDKI